MLPFSITSNLSQWESRYHSEFFIWFVLDHHKRKCSLCFVFSHLERFWSLWFSWFQILSKAGKSSGEQDGDDNDDDDDDDDDITNMNDDLNDQEKVNKREGKSVTLEMIKVWRSGLEVWCSVLDCRVYLCPVKCGINADVKMEVQFASLPPDLTFAVIDPFEINRVAKSSWMRVKIFAYLVITAGYSAWHFFTNGVFWIKFPWTDRLLWQLSRLL